MAETELGILGRQCLDRRLPDRPELTAEAAAWERDRNEMECQIDWQFTTADARVKLRRLYPILYFPAECICHAARLSSLSAAA